MNRRSHYYLTEDFPGLRLIEEANNDSGILALGSEKEKGHCHTRGEDEKHKLKALQCG